ncbi:MAG TPA: MEKHLA domain-containing protein [Candidatus Accumulibacter phosphatis]|nr:MAG: MEKHLA domain protein [Candidatus Accumulibacter sp. SK-11]HAY26123.1 MEKHLA domain-containing protein [Accumulibacter sp.]HCN68907.1 MEKHLA domain-containing protein [Accumulibacter sp.]HRL76613.1 MEKHLA domain-containing protein [Candidatus Accumulibacter phosphatis]HRQ94265.1 MEKHLA domain-containing protein [Candidatus Accumulibacter phosphatis]
MDASEAKPFDRSEPDDTNGFQAASAQLILSSHSRLLQRTLLPDSRQGDPARCLYHAPFVVLAHDAAPDPLFFYGNRAAQALFAMPWRQLVHLPSRLSAEPLAREERQRLLDRVARQGFIDDYGGVRIAATGKRFRIAGATVWNLLDGKSVVVGQAAAFANWFPVS